MQLKRLWSQTHKCLPYTAGVETGAEVNQRRAQADQKSEQDGRSREGRSRERGKLTWC